MSEEFILECVYRKGSLLVLEFCYHIYADDVQIYMSFDPNVPGDAACPIFKITSCVEELRVWLMKNLLKFNDSKTEFFIATSSHNMNRLSDINFQIGSEVITPSPTIKNLGITFDSAMTMSDHVTSLFKSVIFLLWNLARIRRFIDHNAASNTIRALILSKLDYGNALLSSCKNNNVARLQRLQNRAARIEFQVPHRHSSSPLLGSLVWLPIDKRIKVQYSFAYLQGTE